jgi:hypothetical protein
MYPKIKPHTPHRYNRIVVFNPCGVYSLYKEWTPSCWKIISVSQLEADLEASSVQQFVENFLSMCRQLISYQTGDHNLCHTYVINIYACTILGRSLVQTVAQRRISFAPRPLGFVVDKVALGQVPTEYVGFHLSIWLHQYSEFILHLSLKFNNFNNSKRR